MRRFFLASLIGILIAQLAFGADAIIQYNEKMVGANHPTLADTLNRGLLVEHDKNGQHTDITAHSITGDNTGTISGYTLGGPGYTDTVRAGDIITKGPWVDVRAYGTTLTQADIQNSVDNNSSRTNLPLFVPDNTYTISSQINVTRGGFVLRGNGSGSVLQTKANTDTDILYAHGADNAYIDTVIIENIRFDGNRLNQSSEGTTRIGIHARYVSNLVIRNCEFINFGYNASSVNAIGKAIQIEDVDNVRIINNYFYNNHISIAVAEPSNILPVITSSSLVSGLLVANNYIDGNSTYTSGPWAIDAISLHTKLGSSVTGNIVKNISNNYMGVYVNAIVTSSTGAQKAVIANNVFTNIGGVAIEAETSSAYPVGLYYVINGNHIDNVGQLGISSFGSSVISNNLIINPWDNSQTGGYGITLSGSNVSVSGNVIIDNRAVPIMKSGIFMQISDNTVAENISMANNIVNGSSTYGIQITTTETGTTTRIHNASIIGNILNAILYLKTQTSPLVNGVDNIIVTGNSFTGYIGPTNGSSGVSLYNNTIGGVSGFAASIPTINGPYDGYFVYRGVPADPAATPSATENWGWRFSASDNTWTPIYNRMNINAPATSTTACTTGQMAFNNTTGYLYICTVTNNWKRAAIAAW